MRYTPGPWEVFGDHEVKAVYGKMFMDDSELCPVMRLGQGINTKANARLIAACPDMYEYILNKANDGDKYAAKIINSINAE